MPMESNPTSSLDPEGLQEKLDYLQNQLTVQRATIQELRDAPKSAREIGVAMGIVMARTKLTSEEAFLMLATRSQQEDVKVRDVAAQIIMTGLFWSESGWPRTLCGGLSASEHPGTRKRVKSGPAVADQSCTLSGCGARDLPEGSRACVSDLAWQHVDIVQQKHSNPTCRGGLNPHALYRGHSSAFLASTAQGEPYRQS